MVKEGSDVTFTYASISPTEDLIMARFFVQKFYCVSLDLYQTMIIGEYFRSSGELCWAVNVAMV